MFSLRLYGIHSKTEEKRDKMSICLIFKEKAVKSHLSMKSTQSPENYHKNSINAALCAIINIHFEVQLRKNILQFFHAIYVMDKLENHI